MNKKKIAVIAGGDSSEYVVSVRSAKNIFDSIDTEKYIPYLILMKEGEWDVLVNEQKVARVSKEDFSFILNNEKISPDYAFIMIHGTPGEDGKLQSYFDLIKMPYSTCGAYASSLTFHKFYCDNFLRAFNVPMAKSLYFQKGDPIEPAQIIAQLGLPLFIKPSAGGSSFGVSKVLSKEQILPAIELAYNESNDCLCEEFIEGMELAIGVCELDGKVVPFLPTEVIPKGDFFDFDSKYQLGGATEITPARLSQDKLNECMQLSAHIYKLIACHGIVRVDFILKNDTFYFLEINTVPGMTETSFIPQQLHAMGKNLQEVVSNVIDQKLK